MAFSFNTKVTLKDGAQLDSFGQLRTSSPFTLFDLKHQYGKNSLDVNESLTGGATSTHDANASHISMSVTSTGDKVIRQTKRYFTYQPGKSLRIEMTGVLATATASGVSSKIGYFDDSNGFFFELDGTALSVWKRSNVTGSVVNTQVSQASWNVDKFDGTGVSGITIDPTKAQIFFIDLQYLGVGRVRMGFVIDGTLYYAHQFLHANSTSTAYTTTATLPVRYEIERLAGSGAATMRMICSTVHSEGGFNPLGHPFTVNLGGTTQSVNAEEGVIAIRAASGNERISLNPLDITAIGTTNDSLLIRLYRGIGLVTSGTWTAVGNGSLSEYMTGFSGNFSVAGVNPVSSFYLSNVGRAANKHISDLIFTGSNISGTSSEELLLTIEGTSGAANVLASMDFQELF